MNSYKISRVPVVGGGKRERRTPFSQRIDELADNLKGFLPITPVMSRKGRCRLPCRQGRMKELISMRRTNMPKTYWFPKRRAKVPIFRRRPWRISSSRRQKRRQALPLFPDLLCLERRRRLLLQALAQQRRTACCQKGGRGSGLDNRPGRRHGAARRFRLVSFSAGRRSEFAGQNQVLLG